MTISLYDVSVASYLQILGGAARFLDKGSTHCREHGPDLSEIVETRLHPDMLPFRFQVYSVAHHSLGALKSLQAGVFRPAAGPPDIDYDGLQNVITEAREELHKLTPPDVDALEGKDVMFEFGEDKVPFTAENFVLSFSLPNLYFHAATAYDILRMKGVPLGKRDFTGRLRIKQ